MATLSKHILVVDDDLDFLELVQAKLNAFGFATDAAHDGAEAVQKARQNLPDLIVMDVEMPGENGVDATLELAKDQRTRDIPIIFLTNLDNQALSHIRETLAGQPGPRAYFRKQDSYDALIRSIGALVTA
jgi:CheY-like chemotaxis protein